MPHKKNKLPADAARRINMAMEDNFPRLNYIAFREKGHGFVYTRPAYDGQMPCARVAIDTDKYTLFIDEKRIMRSTLKNCLTYVHNRIEIGVITDGPIC